MSEPRVVQLVPAWRAAAFIDQTLEALAAQSYPNLEILISDDASPDDTAAICERRAARDPRFRLIRQPANLGWIGNVNALLRAARGDYLAFAFHDDWPAPTYVERCVAALESNSGAVLAFSDVELVNLDGSREARTYPLLDGVADRLPRARRVARQQGAWWIPNRGVFRASAAKEIGGLRRHLAGEFAADWPWLLHMSLLGEFVRVPERLCTKIYRDQSLSRQWEVSARAWAAVALSAMREVARAKIPLGERLALHGTLAALAGLRCRRAIRQAVERRLRGPGSTGPGAPVAAAGSRD